MDKHGHGGACESNWTQVCRLMRRWNFSAEAMSLNLSFRQVGTSNASSSLIILMLDYHEMSLSGGLAELSLVGRVIWKRTFEAAFLSVLIDASLWPDWIMSQNFIDALLMRFLFSRLVLSSINHKLFRFITSSLYEFIHTGIIHFFRATLHSPHSLCCKSRIVPANVDTKARGAQLD